jgi:tetratricopeptide (TPR) repeat protein
VLADRYGLALSTSSQAARDAYVEAVDRMLAYHAGAEEKLAMALAADPDFALAHIALARAKFVAAQVSQARAAAARARELATRTTPREQGHVDAIALAIEGRAPDALAATRAHVARFPRDAMALAPATGVFGLLGFSGRQQHEEELLALLESVAPHYGSDWWFLCMLAFAASECGRLDEARDLIERSLAGNPRNPNAAHVRTHVLYEMGAPAPALRSLDAEMPGFAKEGLLHCHLSWHVALLALELGQTERAWEVYRADVHPGGAWGPPINVASDAPAFLWRAELAGWPRRAELWREVNEYVGSSFPKAGLAFVDVHHAVACAAIDDGACLERLIGELSERLAAGKLPAGEVVPRLAEGFAAFARSDWEGAIALFERSLPETVRIGGSRAQRDLVEHTLLAAYLRAGRAEDARRTIARRLDRRPTVNVAGIAGT